MADLPDWFAASVIKGLYGTELKTIQVDELGRLYAILRALYGTTQKDVQCDASGNLTLNLKAQDLSEIINRPKYGAANQSLFSDVVAEGTDGTLLNVSGKGILYGGYINADSLVSKKTDYFFSLIDGVTFTSQTFYQLMYHGVTYPTSNIFQLMLYDDTNFKYSVCLMSGITFETSLKIVYHNASASGVSVYSKIFYALV